MLNILFLPVCRRLHFLIGPDQASERMANRERTRGEEEEKEAKEFLDERRVLDGQEIFWSQESEVRLRILASEERLKNSPQGQDLKSLFKSMLLNDREDKRNETGLVRYRVNDQVQA